MCTLIMNDYDLWANTDAVAAPAPRAPCAPCARAPFDLCCLGWQGI